MKTLNTIPTSESKLRLITPVVMTDYTRLILTEYSGGADSGRAARSMSLEGALRAALIRIVHGQYDKAVIFDERFGHKSLAITVKLHAKGVTITWPKVPAWRTVA